jgi:hypothetical protein
LLYCETFTIKTPENSIIFGLTKTGNDDIIILLSRRREVLDKIQLWEKFFENFEKST